MMPSESTHRPALRGAVRSTTKRADVVVAASQAIADELNLPATILRPGVDLDAFTPTPPPPGLPKALIAGALVPWKRPDLAVEIARRMPDVHFTFAGEPLPGDPIPALDAPSNVTFAGRVDMLFIGPFDLSQAMGVTGDFFHPKCLAAIER